METPDNNDRESDSEVSFNINKINSRKLPKIKIKINEVDTLVLVDTGSSLNVLDTTVDKQNDAVAYDGKIEH